VALPFQKDFLSCLETVQLWDGSPLPSALHARMKREYQRYRLVKQQIQPARARAGRGAPHFDCPGGGAGAPAVAAKGIGMNSAWVYVIGISFPGAASATRREGGLPGWMTPTPFQSGESSREQGISKSGNRRIRAMAIEIAWCLVAFPT